jgi:nascent polypeptide-associated complex subunit beta
LRRLAESYQSMQKKEGGAEAGKKEGMEAGGDDDDEIPELVEGENFEGKVE